MRYIVTLYKTFSIDSDRLINAEREARERMAEDSSPFSVKITKLKP